MSFFPIISPGDTHSSLEIKLRGVFAFPQSLGDKSGTKGRYYRASLPALSTLLIQIRETEGRPGKEAGKHGGNVVVHVTHNAPGSQLQFSFKPLKWSGIINKNGDAQGGTKTTALEGFNFRN